MKLAIIPARIGSKGVPKKNIKLLGDKPLIAYTINAAKNSEIFDFIHISTDSQEVLDIANNFGDFQPSLRPKNLATDTSPMIDVIKYTIDLYPTVDTIFLLQPTAPFRTSEDIIKAYEIFKSRPYDSLISVKETPHQYNPSWAFEEKEKGSIQLFNGDKEPIARRQDLPKTYYREGSIYVFKKNTLEKYNNIYGKSIGYYNIERETVNIDTIEDFIKAEKILLNDDIIINEKH